jgi:hypothetical protein
VVLELGVTGVTVKVLAAGRGRWPLLLPCSPSRHCCQQGKPGANQPPLLIGSQDQGLASGLVVGLGGDVALTIEEQHPQELAGGNRSAEAGGYEELHRDDADRASAGEGSGGHG